VLRSAALSLLVLLLVAVPAGAEEIRATNGSVTAVVKYVPKGDFEFRGLRITIAHGLSVDYNKKLTVRGCAQPFCRPGDLNVVDLDADGEPEILVDVFTGGAHCCVIAQLFEWDGLTYRTTQHDFRDAGYSVEDLDGDGRPELSSADARFAYQFASFAGSGFPFQAFQVDAGRFVDVTAGFPDQLRADAQAHWREWVKRRGKPRWEGLGPFSAWVADMERLGETDRIATEIARAKRHRWLRAFKPWASGKQYLAELDRFLKQLGYRQ
jgi:hypothetical protein